MNITDAKYKDFALVKEMLETPEIMRNFDFAQSRETAAVIQSAGRLFLTGEGSSRIFPAKNMIRAALQMGSPLAIATEGSRQAHEYKLDDYAVFGASNSGQTKEVISLFTKLAAEGNEKRFGLTANDGTRLNSVSNKCYTLTCGKENAVAATKSVVEQAMFYVSLVIPTSDCGCGCSSSCPLTANQALAADKGKQVLETELAADLVKTIVDAPVVYFAGRNDGVAEELALKTNEITRKKSDYLEGTYAVHGIEEVMNADEVVIVIDPFAEEIEKFKEVLVDGVGMKVIAISSEDTIFPTIKIPKVAGFDKFLQLLAGWNVLVHVGVAAGIDLDKPQRARKIGNEFVG